MTGRQAGQLLVGLAYQALTPYAGYSAGLTGVRRQRLDRSVLQALSRVERVIHWRIS
jgi:hypothetical protein